MLIASNVCFRNGETLSSPLQNTRFQKNSADATNLRLINSSKLFSLE